MRDYQISEYCVWDMHVRVSENFQLGSWVTELRRAQLCDSTRDLMDGRLFFVHTFVAFL